MICTSISDGKDSQNAKNSVSIASPSKPEYQNQMEKVFKSMFEQYLVPLVSNLMETIKEKNKSPEAKSEIAMNDSQFNEDPSTLPETRV